MAKLRHQLLDDDRVLISVVGQQNSVRVESSEAKRFAWALLADLEPDEAGKAGYIEPTQPHYSDYRPKMAVGGQRAEILDALRAGYTTSVAIGNHLGIPSRQVAVRLSKLKAAGQVVMIAPGRPGNPGKWRVA